MTDNSISTLDNISQATETTLPQTCSSLRTISRRLVRQLGMLNADGMPLHLSPVQAHALIEISNQELSVNQLAQQLNINKSNASRAVSQLCEKGLAQSRTNPRDSRSSLCKLTPQGKRQLKNLNQQQNTLYQQILAQLSAEQVSQLTDSLNQYSRAIAYAEQQQDFEIRSITPSDNPQIARVIRNVSAEYGLTPDKGYGVADPTLDSLYQVYEMSDAHYWVITHNGKVLGGAGIAPLAGHDGVCELQKMYFSPSLRGKGFARRLALQALTFARNRGYQACYLETTASLKEALVLYEKLGFEHLNQPLGDTGHDACEIAMLLKL